MDELKTHIVIDFDGTIFTNSFPEVGELIPHAKTIINRWYENNTIVINTCRAGKYEGMAEDALKEWYKISLDKLQLATINTKLWTRL